MSEWTVVESKSTISRNKKARSKHNKTYLIFFADEDISCQHLIGKAHSKSAFIKWFKDYFKFNETEYKALADNFVNRVVNNKTIHWDYNMRMDNSISIHAAPKAFTGVSTVDPSSVGYTFSLGEGILVCEVYIIDNPDTNKYFIKACKTCLCKEGPFRIIRNERA